MDSKEDLITNTYYFRNTKFDNYIFMKMKKNINDLLIVA